jgi:beta-barrel assembly-enhancing protease
MKRTLKAFLWLMIIPTLMISSACDPDDKSINIFTIQDDIALGNQVAAEIASDPAKYPVLSRTQYAAAYEHLDRIMNTILATKLVAYDTVFPWKTYIIKDDSVVNAFATPGGHLYFYTGLIKELENEAQFAGVMAHEMAHCARRHSTDQLTRYYGLSLLVAIVLGENPSMLKQVAADIASGLAALAFSRNMEYEADAYAIKYLSSTDYHPLGLADFFIKMEGLPRPPTFLSTHPSPEDRIDKINEAWVANGSKVGDYFETRYQSFKATLP